MLRSLTLFSVINISGCTSLTSLLFYPDTHYYRTPAQLGVASEVVLLKSHSGATLHNWLIKPSGPTKASILFLHGNGENISTHIGSVAWLTRQGFEILLLDYQGYGLSTGTSTLRTAMEDIEVAHQWLSHRGRQPLIMLGQSMGGALAIAYLSSAPPELQSVDVLVTESAPASWPQIAREVMRKHWLTWLLQAPASLMTSRYDAEDLIVEISEIPVLMLHSPDDQIVPYHHLQQILDNAGDNVHHLNTQGKHISGMADGEIRQAIVDFMQQGKP